MYLAQFIPDADAAALDDSATVAPNSIPAMRLMNRIKLDMERALGELGAMGVYAVPK